MALSHGTEKTTAKLRQAIHLTQTSIETYDREISTRAFLMFLYGLMFLTEAAVLGIGIASHRPTWFLVFVGAMTFAAAVFITFTYAAYRDFRYFREDEQVNLHRLQRDLIEAVLEDNTTDLPDWAKTLINHYIPSPKDSDEKYRH